MKKFLSLIITITMLLATFSFAVSADEAVCEHELMHMRNDACHYDECTICFELFNVGDHTMENGVCTVCNYPNTAPWDDDVKGEGEHEHILMNMANMNCHYEECQVCFELFNVGDHTFADEKCTVCGHPEYKNPFADVANDAWYSEDVATAVSTGLINGKSETEFKPDDYLTYAEAIKLAACMNQLYTEKEVTLTNGTPWYQTYLDYCKEKGIVRNEYNYGDYATRVGYMYIFSLALPDEAYEVINDIEDGAISDVPADAPYAACVYKLYRAGIVTGVDELHNCNPTANIKRSEVAVIVARMMDPSKRKRFSLGSKVNEEIDITTPDIEINGNDSVVVVPDDIYNIDVDGDQYLIDNTKEPVEILTNPSNVEVEGYSASATLVAEAEGGTGVYTYQWKYRSGRDTFDIVDDGFYVLGANTSKLSIVVTPTGNLIGKSIYCTITDANGTSVNSTAARVFGPFAMKVEDRSYDAGKGTVLVGTLDDGWLKKGDGVSVSRNGKIIAFGTVTEITMFDKNLDEAMKGDRVGIVFSTTMGASPAAGDTLIRYQDYHVIDDSDIVN